MSFVTPQTFVEQAVLSVLIQHGFENLNENDQQAFFPQFVAEAERRLGLVVLPRLNEEGAAEFENLLRTETNPEKWNAFWTKYLPDFNNLMTETLEKFGEEIAAVMPK